MTNLGERVKAERRAKGWSQAELARRVTRAGYSITQGGIAQIERRGDQLALVEGGRRGRRGGATAASAAAARASGRPPLQVFASAQGGSEGAMLLSNEPVSWIPRDPRLEGLQDAYGCFVSGDSMEPAYERGNLLLVNPSADVSPGDDCVFLRETADGQRYVLIKRLVRRNEGSWTVKQYNPAKTYTLSRREWQKAHLVIGKYNRAS